MELIEWIVADENIDKAIKAVKGNKGAPGIDKMPVEYTMVTTLKVQSF